MKITDAFVLAPDVELVPVTELSREFQRLSRSQRGDYALAHPRRRRPARVIDATLGKLLSEFRSPSTIVDAVMRASPALGMSESVLLNEAFPLLQKLITEGVVVTEKAVEGAKLEATFRADDNVASFVVRTCLHLLQDTELYLARDPEGRSVVVKFARANRTVLGDFDTETDVLDRLGGGVAPALRKSGTWNGQRFIAMEWRPGVNAELAAADQRLASPGASLAAIAEICVSIAEAYARLHESGIVHGDVHEGNVLVDEEGAVTLIDFGLARIIDDPRHERIVRGGYAYYAEPELALARLSKAPAPPATFHSDQYSLAAMIYFLLTGMHYIEFDLRGDEANTRIARAPMLSFADRGVMAWPGVEAVLARALSKAPDERFATTREFADALRRVVSAGGAVGKRHVGRRRRSPDLNARFLATVTGLGAPARMKLLKEPTASVMHGASGIAYALYRLALLRDDAELLSQADCWIVDAASLRRHRGAFHDGQELTPANVPRQSIVHGATGLDVVQALVANAMGDVVTMNDAIRRIIAAGDRATDSFDCSLGLPGVLLGACLVLEAVPRGGTVDGDRLRRAGDRWSDRIARALAGRKRVDADPRRVNLGVAHGWAGALYALLRWSGTARSPLTSVAHRRLQELGAAGDPEGRGMRWAWRQRRGDGTITSGHMPGWCNGSAGMTHLWIEAHRVTGSTEYARLAELAAWDAWRDRGEASFNLCCGLAGQAYAMFACARFTGREEWLARGRTLTERAVLQYDLDDSAPPSLFKGLAGVALLQSEARDPHHARMPLFEAEGWPRSLTSIEE